MKEEIVPVEVKSGKKVELFSEDDHRRPETTLETLSKLPSAFRKDGIVTAGNASGIVDGAAAVVVTHAKIARERGWDTLGRIVSWATVGVEPRLMGIGPVPASQKALARCGIENWTDRSSRSERGFRAAISGGGKGAGTGPRKNEREWRSDRARASAGRVRYAVDTDTVAGIAAAESALWSGDGVHWGRAGHCNDCRSNCLILHRDLTYNSRREPAVRNPRGGRFEWRLKK